jgi:upstream activation factor subunit UAF30
MKPLTPSAALGAVIGAKAVPRTEAVKKIWVYIKANKLQDSKNKRMINADAKLKVVFAGKAQVSMFDMAKYLAKNLS